MDRRVKIWRLSLCIALGLVLGGVFGMIIWRINPMCPKVDVFSLIQIPTISSSTSPLAPLAVETPEQTPVRILFVGDMMLDRSVKLRTQASKDPAYPFQRLPQNWFDSFDYAVANMEGSVTDKRRSPEKSIDFQFDPSVLPVLKNLGVDAFSQANNHALDQGNIGYDDSVRRMREAGFLVFGHQVRDDQVALATTTVKGERFAFLGFNTTDNPLDRIAASSTLALAKSEAEHVIVFMHWGTEYRDKPDASSIDTAHWLIDHGADIVIGGHPHWTQGFSTYKDKPIIWSLGNFIFDQDFSVQTRQGLAVTLTFDGKKISIEPIPLQIDMSQPRLAEGEDRAKRLESIAKVSDEALIEQIKSGMLRF